MGYTSQSGAKTGTGAWGGWPGVSASDASAAQPSAGILSQTSQPNTHEKTVNDYPPTWDGNGALHKLEPYLKELDGWIHTTKTQPQLQGWTIFRYSKDDLRMILGELTAEELKQPGSGRVVYNKIKESFSECLGMEIQYAGKYEALLCESAAKRKGDENMIQYIGRKKGPHEELGAY